MTLRADIRTARTVITGRTQTGKTSFLRCKLLDKLDAYIIYDPDVQFTGYGKLVKDTEEMERAVQQIKDRVIPPKIVFQVRDELMMGDMAELLVDEFEVLCQQVARFRNLTFVIDEISTVTRPAGRKVATMPPTLSLILKRRMKAPHNIGVILTTQRMKDADVDFLTQSQLVYTFQQNPTDAKYVAEKLGMNLKWFTDEIMTLEPYYYLKYDHTTQRIKKGTYRWKAYPLPEVTSPPKRRSLFATSGRRP